MKLYNKLVRDKIPQVIAEDGKKCYTATLTEEEYKELLKKKLYEEINEFYSAASYEDKIEEMVDILTVIDAIKESEDLDQGDLNRNMSIKNYKRGVFKDKVFLLGVED